MSLMAFMALPGVIVGSAVVFLTCQEQLGARAFLLVELVWLLVLALAAVLPVHGESGLWVNPVRNVRLMADAVAHGKRYDEALKATQPAMQRELEADSVECVAEGHDTAGKVNWPRVDACLGARGWIRITTARQMAGAYARAWWTEGVDPGIIAGH